MQVFNECFKLWKSLRKLEHNYIWFVIEISNFEGISRSMTFQFFTGVNTSFWNWRKFHESEKNNFLENLSVLFIPFPFVINDIFRKERNYLVLRNTKQFKNCFTNCISMIIKIINKYFHQKWRLIVKNNISFFIN